MKLLTVVVAAFWAVLWASPAVAAPERIAVVDMVSLISEHPRATELQRQLEQRQSEAETYAKNESVALRELQAQIELMNRNNPMRRVREKELVTQQTIVKLELEFKKEEALREYMDGLEALYMEVQRYVARYARDNAIQLVLLKSEPDLRAADFNDYGAKVRLRGVVYHDDTLDITDQIRALFMPRAPQPVPGNNAQPPQPGNSGGNAPGPGR